MFHPKFSVALHGGYAVRVDDVDANAAVAGRIVLALRSFQLLEDRRDE